MLQTRTRSRAAFTLLAVPLVILSSACRVRTDVGIDMKEDGSGSVTIRVGLDEDAMKRAPNFQQALKVDDLTNHGWTLAGPTKETDGFTYVSASKPFANPGEAQRIFAEISGPDGPFRDFTINRTRSFAKTKVHFTGTIDFSRGIASFSDSELAKELDGQPVGDDVKAIEQHINDSLDNVFQFQLAVRLPGDVTSNAPRQLANGAIWEPRLSQSGSVALEASSTTSRWFTIVGTAVAAVCALLLVALLVLLGLRRRRRPSLS